MIKRQFYSFTEFSLIIFNYRYVFFLITQWQSARDGNEFPLHEERQIR